MAKQKLFLIIAATFIVATLAYAQQDSLPTPELRQTGLPEMFVKKVLFEAKWGNEQGKFGFRMWEGEPDFPKSFVVDSKSNIYILDQLNNRIQIFNNNGKHKKSFTISTYVLADSEEIVTSKNSWNKLGNEYAKIYSNEIFIDLKDNLYIPIRDISKKGLRHRDIYKITTGEYKVTKSNDDELLSARNKYIGETLGKTSDNIMTLKKTNDHMYRMLLDKPQVVIYDAKGKSVDTLNLVGLPNIYGKYPIINSIPQVDNNGNIYQLELIPNTEQQLKCSPSYAYGIMLIKWEKVK